MKAPGTKYKGAEIVRDVFGGLLAQQGRGFYVALELLSIVWGMERARLRPLQRGGDGRIRYVRRTHDFARRVLAEPESLTPDERAWLGPGAESVLRSLLQGLVVPIPGQRATIKLPTCHFFPYVGELVHYDAVWRGKKVSLERNSYRGAGALAYRLLSDDGDEERLAQVRTGLLRLVSEDGGPLGTLAYELSQHDAAPGSARDAETIFDDDDGSETKTLESPWVDVFRQGVANIVTREDVARARRVDALVHWVPFCIAMHALALARTRLGEDPASPIVFECGVGRSPLKSLARDHASKATATIARALEHAARESGDEQLTKDSQKWRDAPRTFFTTTLGVVGAFNAMTGLRHFCISPQLLEAIVLATVPEDVDLDQFVSEVMHRRLGMVIDGDAAAEAGLLARVDREEFKANRNALGATLKDLGLLREFSDMTKLVTSRMT
jgi:hypothetical protein